MSIKGLVIRLTPKPVLHSYQVYKCAKRGYHTPVYAGADMSEQMDKFIPMYIKKNKLSNKAYLDNLKKDMCRAWYEYNISPHEYLMYDFMVKSDEERSTYVSDVYKDYMLDTLDGHKNYEFLSDKYAFYLKTRKYFNREVIQLDSNTGMNEFVEFAVRNKNLFIKKNGESYGHGTMIVDLYTAEDARNYYSATLIGGGNFVIEKRLTQNAFMARWNDSSVNTVRINSFLNTDGHTVLAPFIRFGRKGSIVDNGGSGGIFACIDSTSGEIITNAKDELGNEYKLHPDSQVRIKGEVIPYWNELIETAKAVHKSLPNHLYIGFDFALNSDNQWTLIEGNWGQFVCQQSCLKRGLKNEYKSLMTKKKYK